MGYSSIRGAANLTAAAGFPNLTLMLLIKIEGVFLLTVMINEIIIT